MIFPGTVFTILSHTTLNNGNNATHYIYHSNNENHKHDIMFISSHSIHIQTLQISFNV